MSCDRPGSPHSVLSSIASHSSCGLALRPAKNDQGSKKLYQKNNAIQQRSNDEDEDKHSNLTMKTFIICPCSPSSLLLTCFVLRLISFTTMVLLCLIISVISPILPLSRPEMTLTVSPSLTCILWSFGRLFGLHSFRSHRLSCRKKEKRTTSE